MVEQYSIENGALGLRPEGPGSNAYSSLFSYDVFTVVMKLSDQTYVCHLLRLSMEHH